jgi:hypothetical protein
MKRDATNVIWRTGVVAGAMLGAPACSKKQAPTTPQPAVQQSQAAQPATAPDTTNQPATDPNAPDPAQEDCRVRGCDDDGGGGVGRGFILA